MSKNLPWQRVLVGFDLPIYVDWNYAINYLMPAEDRVRKLPKDWELVYSGDGYEEPQSDEICFVVHGAVTVEDGETVKAVIEAMMEEYQVEEAFQEWVYNLKVGDVVTWTEPDTGYVPTFRIGSIEWKDRGEGTLTLTDEDGILDIECSIYELTKPSHFAYYLKVGDRVTWNDPDTSVEEPVRTFEIGYIRWMDMNEGMVSLSDKEETFNLECFIHELSQPVEGD
jgi:hypothetical protein